MIEIVQPAQEKKIKILWLADHYASPSGISNQSRYIVDGLIKSGKFSVVYLGGALKHQNYQPVKVNEDLMVIPVDGYGNKDIVRSIIRTEKPDILFFFTDPRFWGFLWETENEIRPLIPMVYYHVWDNYPIPKFNKKYYDSCDTIFTISRLTQDIVSTLSPEVPSYYIGHSVDPDIFKLYPPAEVQEMRQKLLKGSEDKFIFFWNNRNARRKQSGSLVWWFNDFLNEVGRDKAVLVMHTDPRDPNGQDLVALMEELDLTDGQVLISNQKLDPKILALMNNAADCAITISDAEGWGIMASEALACETPVIATKTGGLQDQNIDHDTGEVFGVAIEPASKAIIGSLDVHYIYEDRLAGKDVVAAMKKMYLMSPEERKTLGQHGKKYIQTHYNFQDFQKFWVEKMLEVHEKFGSWETRKNHTRYTLTEIK